jgi:hypothetical protein
MIYILLIDVILCGIVIYEMINAPIGYEDEKGYHNE